MSGECYWLSVCYSSPSSVSRLYTSLRRWKFWIVVWENTNGVHFRAVWKNRAHVQGIRCSPKGSHLIPWTTAVFSNTTLKWTPLAYHTELLRDVHPMLFWFWASFVNLPSTIHSKHKTSTTLAHHWNNTRSMSQWFLGKGGPLPTILFLVTFGLFQTHCRSVLCRLFLGAALEANPI